MIKVNIVFCTDKKYPHFFELGGQTVSRGWPTSLNIRPHRAHFFKAKHIYCNNTKKVNVQQLPTHFSVIRGFTR